MVTNNTPRLPGYIPIMEFFHKYSFKKVLGFTVTEGGGSNDSGDIYISHFPDNYSNVSI